MSFIGRMSPEKGVATFLGAAQSLGHLKFRVAGEQRAGYDAGVPIPGNVSILGFLTGAAFEKVFRESRNLVFPSITKAGFMIGGQYGDGVLWQGGKPVGYYNTSGASYGLQAGAQKYGYAMFFKMDLKSLGYTLKASTSVVCTQCHGQKEAIDWYKVHEKHVKDKQYDCSFCHGFTRPERNLRTSR